MEDEEKDKEEGAEGELSDGALDEVLEETDDDEEDLATGEAGEDEYNERDWA